MQLISGTRLGRYEIRSKIGAGGMGEVYLAQDTELHRRVAVKMFPSEFTQSEQRLSRFRQEAYAASALNHPNIITIHEIGKTHSLHYLVTEFVDGQSLRQRLLKTLKLGETLDIAIQIASALSAAHAAGIIHRDIKPENIMLRQDGIVKVLDFGVARVMIAGAVESEAETRSLLTTPGTILGTMPYMSPEQLRGEVVDGRSDIFSFGVVLYEMLSGRQPFASGSAATTISAILNEEPPTLLRYAPDLPEELQRIARKCLEKDRNLRYQHTSEVRADLQRLKRDTESAQMAISAKPEAKTEADAPPTGNKAVYAFLELFALAFTFEGAAALLRGESLWKIAGAWLVAVFFFVAGIRWPKIRLLLEQRFGSKRERIAPHGTAPDRIANVPHDRKGVAFTPRNVIVPAAAVVLAFLAAAYFYSPRAGSGAINSVAVLPFVNAGGDSQIEYLSDGLTESLITNLSQLPKLSVKARSSVFRYKGKDAPPQQVGKELNVH